MADDASILELATLTFDVKCPHCGRFERFEDKTTGLAWVTGHIQAEHADELPSRVGTGTEETNE